MIIILSAGRFNLSPAFQLLDLLALPLPAHLPFFLPSPRAAFHISLEKYVVYKDFYHLLEDDGKYL